MFQKSMMVMSNLTQSKFQELCFFTLRVGICYSEQHSTEFLPGIGVLSSAPLKGIYK